MAFTLSSETVMGVWGQSLPGAEAFLWKLNSDPLMPKIIYDPLSPYSKDYLFPTPFACRSQKKSDPLNVPAPPGNINDSSLNFAIKSVSFGSLAFCPSVPRHPPPPPRHPITHIFSVSFLSYLGHTWFPFLHQGQELIILHGLSMFAVKANIIECYIIKPAQSLLMKHLVIGQR